ncbi:GNAT family N-acetyltransferase [Marinicella sp. S1101]|uniref:GNAT family N-acetyltransferase n=1 Tax=Marinicella marina TaxID=2996016 RepID=UPI002260CE7F|nr:GNAT family N-acetyltransferase [Marinicella marina]MCX7553993.1 GNAT family N-acetyltransferase [Marinicella marina]MDJ1140485.1 GNAT family N-acetyltransferase [Marinicella marina]
MSTQIVQVDYHNPQHAKHMIELLDCYATDPMGGGVALSDYTTQNLVPELAKRADAFSLIAYVDGQPAGLTNCFEGFSTFACRPLINIHDVVVASEYRRMGVSRKMFDQVEFIANQRGCCKLTLEVLDGNSIAQAAYEQYGFRQYQLDDKNGAAMFWEKQL